MARRQRIAYTVTRAETARYLLTGHLAFLRRHGVEVLVIAAPGRDLEFVAAREGVETVAVPMEREERPLADLRALVRMCRVFRRLRPALVNASTPKAGLLGMLAAALSGVPARVYTLRGLRLETARGVRRWLMALAERVACACAHRVVCVGPSLAGRCRQLRLAPVRKVRVLGDGSSNGVDVTRFRPRADGGADDAEATELAHRIGLPRGMPVVGFVGRMSRDKGVGELAAAFLDVVLPACPDARLLIVGPVDLNDPAPEGARERLLAHPRVVFAGFVPDAAPYYRLMDVLAFPSLREGFPNAPLEAAASGVPVVGFAVTGTVDAVVDGVTGRLVPAGDWRALGEAVADYLADPERACADGRRGRARVEERFTSMRVWRAWLEEYRDLLAERLPAAAAEPGDDRR
jgi:glycosyltransferase involved in cell wall biosynthesis